MEEYFVYKKNYEHNDILIAIPDAWADPVKKICA